MRNEEVATDVRSTEWYKDACCEAVGLGPVPDSRYSHFTYPADSDALRWWVRRWSRCMALPDTPRTSVRGFQHRLITVGGPVKQGLHRTSATDTAWIDQAVQEDVARGQLIRGNSHWGSPAFPPKKLVLPAPDLLQSVIETKASIKLTMSLKPARKWQS